MATIKDTLALEDRITPTLSKAEKCAIQNIKTFNQMSKEVDNLKRSLDEAEKVNPKIVGTEAYSKQFELIEKLEGKLHDVATGQDAFSSSLDRTKYSLNSTSSNVGNFIKGLVGLQAVQKIFSLITNQIGSAISRYDTLNNYSNVMQNLGISEEQANASRERLSAGLKGLPTTLDSATSAVQRFTSANSNIGYSTEMYLALNNAILAGGASMQIQQSALEQISQSYAKGKPDMMEWRALQQAMPGQLKQIATAMNTTTTKLGEGLRTGKIRMNDFMNTIIKLNKEGINGFKSFEEQAKSSTNGINTSIANMKSAVTRGVAKIIENINKELEKNKLPNISQIISGIGKAIEKVLGTISKVIKMIIKILSPVLKIIQQIGNFISKNWSIIEPIILGIVGALGFYYGSMLAINTIQTILKASTVALTIAQNIFNGSLYACPITWIVVAIGVLIGILAHLYNTNDEVAYNLLYAWDCLRLGAMALKLICQEAFYGIVLAGLYMWTGWLGIRKGMETGFYAVVLAGLQMRLKFEGVCEGIVNGFIWMYNKIVGLLNKLGAKFETMNYADFTSQTVGQINNTMQKYLDTVGITQGQIDEAVGKANDVKKKMSDIAKEGSKNILSKAQEYNKTRDDRVANRKNISDYIGESTTKALEGLNDVVGSDNSGGKALKTTTDDKLFSDEDIQLLLDVATRDYKLNYQQVTPQITLTFGDIKETADVDEILDEVADKLQEIYDGNLEVV